MKFIIYLIIFYLVYQVFKLIKRISQSSNNAGTRKDEKLRSKYDNIEEADYKDLGNESRNKSSKE